MPPEPPPPPDCEGASPAGSPEPDAAADAVLRAQTAERLRIAAALHDDTLQVIDAALISLDRVVEMVEWRRDSQGLALLRGARAVLAEAADRTRQFAFELLPVEVKNHGLADAITTLAERAGREIGAEVSIHIAQERFEQSIEEVVFRTVQEGVANIRKHARAAHFVIDVRRVGDQLVVLVEDDGRGFDVAAVQPRGGSRHIGLTTMRELVSMAGGTLHLESSPGSGTRLALRIPLVGDRGRPRVPPSR